MGQRRPPARTSVGLAVVAAMVLVVSACAEPGDGVAAGPEAASRSTAPPPDATTTTPAAGVAGDGDDDPGGEDPGDPDPGDAKEFHEAGLLQGVPVTCTLVADGSDDLLAAQERVLARLDPDRELGPLVAVAVDDRTTLIAATSFATDRVLAWLVDTDGAIRAVDGAASADTAFPVATIDTAGESPEAGAHAEASDCSWIAADAAGLRPEPDPVPAEFRPDLILARPNPAASGDLVQLSFPDETFRGLAFQLEHATGEGWEAIAWMTSSANGGDPTTVPVGAEDYAVDDVGIGGPGPDIVRLPEKLEPGEHRVCTANRGAPEICAALAIE